MDKNQKTTTTASGVSNLEKRATAGDLAKKNMKPDTRQPEGH